MRSGSIFASIVLCLFLVLLSGSVIASTALDEDGKWLFSGDFRVRVERDWDSITSAGVVRDDRTRVRFRNRFKLKYKPIDDLLFAVRLRSGSNKNHQSPHMTVIDFDENGRGDFHFNFDQWYVQAKHGVASGWLGRNNFPFWMQNELLWDKDATLMGGFGKLSLSNDTIGDVTINAGYFALPVGMREFSGTLAAGQVMHSRKIGDVKATIGGGVFHFNADVNDKDAVDLKLSNGLRDYTIWVFNIQGKVPTNIAPLTFGLDLYHNSESYSATDPIAFTATNYNETDGFVLSTVLGDIKEAGHWLTGYYYGDLEAFAVNSSYNSDDWARWETVSDLRAHEFRAAYAVTDNFNINARYFIADAISNVEEGQRFRVDFNVKF